MRNDNNQKRIAFITAILGLSALVSGCGNGPVPVAPPIIPVSGVVGGLTTGSCVPILLPTNQSYVSTPTNISVNIQNAWMNSNTLAAGNVPSAPSGFVQPAPAGAYGTVIQGPGAATLPVATGLTMFSTLSNAVTNPDGGVVLTLTSTPTTLGIGGSYNPYLTTTGSRWNGTGAIQISVSRIQQWLNAIGFYNYGGYGSGYGYPIIGVTQPQASTACINSVAINLSYTNVTGSNTLYAGYVSIGATLSNYGGVTGAQQHGFTMKF